ncbi:hypothetical protein FGB62_65g05 [Gracilaria domingensis]|nr:hypothetical protein FGB62_65g05 [Gracilaria domingensis]
MPSIPMKIRLERHIEPATGLYHHRVVIGGDHGRRVIGVTGKTAIASGSGIIGSVTIPSRSWNTGKKVKMRMRRRNWNAENGNRDVQEEGDPATMRRAEAHVAARVVARVTTNVAVNIAAHAIQKRGGRDAIEGTAWRCTASAFQLVVLCAVEESNSYFRSRSQAILCRRSKPSAHRSKIRIIMGCLNLCWADA